MADRILVATRKGLFDLRRSNGAQWQIEGRAFLGEPVSSVHHAGGTVYAALSLGHFGAKLHRSDDDGKTWRELAPPSYSSVGGEAPPSLELIWCLETASDGTLWCGTIPGGLFRSDDRGESWQLNRSLWDEPSRERWFGGGYDQPGIHSICIHPDDPDTLLAGISCGGVWRTTDGGANWEPMTSGMWAQYVPPEQKDDPAIQDPHRLVQCPSSPDNLWVQHHNGIFRSTDGGANWHELEPEPSSFGFAVAVHPRDPDTAWFVPARSDEKRYPADGKFLVNRTTDGGQSFTSLASGLPDGENYDLVYRHALDVDDSGDNLAMGSTTGNLWSTSDGGEHWSRVPVNFPPIYAVRFV